MTVQKERSKEEMDSKSTPPSSLSDRDEDPLPAEVKAASDHIDVCRICNPHQT